MTLRELKKGLLELLQSKYPATEYKYYSLAVVEGFERPSFFTQLKPIVIDPCNKNLMNNQITFYITYMQRSVEEVDILEKISEIRALFGLFVQVGDRAVKVTGFDWDFIGTDRNIVELSIELEWKDYIGQEATEPVMESMEMNEELKEE